MWNKVAAGEARPFLVLVIVVTLLVQGNLDSGVLPLTPMQRMFRVVMGGSERVVTQNQLPLTPAYAFTDYRSQGQTISNAIIDIAMPPSDGLSPFNVYV